MRMFLLLPRIWKNNAKLSLNLVSLFFVFVIFSYWAKHLPQRRSDGMPFNQKRTLNPPKVALLFLSRGSLIHENVLKAWLEKASPMLPMSYIQEQCKKSYGPLFFISKQPNCRTGEMNFNPVENNNLFSTYIHISPQIEYSPNSSFSQSVIKKRVYTSWGDNSLMKATRQLLFQAFKDPQNNQRFVLLSETDIPVFDPFTFYMQLMSENTSRVNACAKGKSDERSPWRWSPKMAPVVNLTEWRKSSQWFSLTRKHVEFILKDKDVYETFLKHCQHSAWDAELGRMVDCIADEHYIPTLFAVLGLEDEMACDAWGIAAVDWSQSGAHPRSYLPQEITMSLIKTLRNESPETGKAIKSAQRQFLHCAETKNLYSLCAKKMNLMGNNEGFESMKNHPKLTARKFPLESAAAVENVLLTMLES